jgi:hypothetical protein
MKILRYIFIFLLVVDSISFVTPKSFAYQQEKQPAKIFTDVNRIETETNFLFIHNSDTIFVSKAIKDISIIFQLSQLHDLFFKDQGYHSISIKSLYFESKKSTKKKKYFKAEGSVPNIFNQFEWLIRIENANATKKMNLEEFIKDAGAALVEIKIQI